MALRGLRLEKENTKAARTFVRREGRLSLRQWVRKKGMQRKLVLSAGEAGRGGTLGGSSIVYRICLTNGANKEKLSLPRGGSI